MNRQQEKMKSVFGLSDIQAVDSPLDFTGRHTSEHENRFAVAEEKNGENPSVMQKYNSII